jgi:hypothetical protein
LRPADIQKDYKEVENEDDETEPEGDKISASPSSAPIEHKKDKTKN